MQKSVVLAASDWETIILRQNFVHLISVGFSHVADSLRK